MNVIKCPVCGQEYLPSEIYLPSEFFGNPGEIVKTESGKIQLFLGSDMNTEEEYICDNCNTTFKVEASITFKVTPKDGESNLTPEEDFEEYVSSFEKKPKIELAEVNLFDDQYC